MVKLGKEVSVAVSVGATVLLPLALPVGCILVMVLVVMLTPTTVTDSTARASATPAVPHHIVVITLLFFVAQYLVRFRNSTELIGGGEILSVGWYLRASRR